MNLFELSAVLTLNKKAYDKGLEDAEKQAETSGNNVSNGLNSIGSKFGKFAVGLTKATVASIVAGGTAVGALVKKSVEEYAEYQQTWGGVQKLYGTAGMSVEQYAESVGKSVDEVKAKYADLEKAQNMVLENAQNAYATAGMSTQQYMEQATMFSASLINSLAGDTVKASEQTDVAMRAIADNYNTFGGDMQLIQGAYQGFARGNYLMLDNLRLGYAGSKTGMEQLIADANEYAKSIGQDANLTIDSFSDIVTAIDLVQQKQGIAGTTAREATETISGSLNMLKASWTNLVAGLSDPDADIGKLIDNVVTSIVGSTDEAGNHVKGVVDNIVPTIQRSVQGVVKVLDSMAPIIAKEFPKLLATLLPMLIDTATQLVTGLVKALPNLVQTLVAQIPTVIETLKTAITELIPVISELGSMVFGLIVDAMNNPTALEDLVQFAIDLVEMLANGITENLPKMIDAGLNALMSFSGTLHDNIGMLIDAGLDLIMALANGLIEALPVMVETIPTIVSNIANIINDNAPKILETGIKIIIALVEGIIQAIPVIVANIPQIVKAIVDVILAFQWLNLGKQIVDFFAKGIKGMLSSVAQAGKDIIKNITEKGGLKNLPKMALEWGKDLIDNFIGGIKANIGKLTDTVKNVAQTVKNFIGFSEPKFGPLSNFHTYAPDMMDLFMQGIVDNKSKLIDTVTDAFNFSDMITAPSLVGVGGVGYNQIVSTSGTSSALEQILAILPQLASTQIVLDTGALVGETVSQYDEALGKMLYNKQRSV